MFRKVCVRSSDYVANLVRSAVAGKGIVGRGGSDKVARMGVSSGGATNDRRTGKGLGPGRRWREPKGGDALGDTPNEDKGGLIGTGVCRGGRRGGRN